MAKVLILEDDYLQATALERVLCGAGHEVVGLARDGESAFTIARERKPDLLVCDLHLAHELDGAEAAAELYRLHHCKVLIVTGYASNVSSAVDVENCGVVRKPWSESDLLEAVDECLRPPSPTRASM